MSKKKKPRPKKSGAQRPTPKPGYELTLRFGENESIDIGFSGYDRGATVIKAMYVLSMATSIEKTAIEFLKQGDESVLEIIQELAEALPVAVDGAAGKVPAS